MKFIGYRNVFYFMFFLNYLLVLSHFGANAQEWCWTKSMANDPSYVFNPSNGGVNWGYCKKGVSSIKQIKYKITLLTSNLPNSGTDSTINIQIFGSKGMTNLQALSSMVESGSKKDFEIEERDVGEINKISLKIEGNKGYRCKTIKIVSDSNSANFNCLERIEPCQNRINNFSCFSELLPEGESAYEITLKSSNAMEENLTSPILIALIGDKGISNLQILSESGIPKGSSVEGTIRVKDIGKISGYKIKISEKGKFKGSHLIVKTIRTGTVDQFDLKDVLLENPGNNSFSYDSAAGRNKDQNSNMHDNEALNKPNSESGFHKLFDEAENLFEKEHNTRNNEEDEDDGIVTFTPSNSDGSQQHPSGLDNSANGEFNLHNPDGGLMDEKEKREIINLDCLQTLSNPDSTSNLFGPNYPTSNINYVNILARCPSNCHKIQGTVYGKGIHPDISPICLSALIDRAVSEYGGIISISIFPGLEKYVILDNQPNNNKNKNGASDKIKTISYYGKPKKSFSLAKVDNVDLSERDLRILNAEGKYSNEGRVEIRINGKWGAICNKLNNANSAQRICRDLGYTSGFWANPEDKPGFCRSYKGKDYCGSSNSMALFNSISCEITDESFNTCVKKYANPSECTNDNDAIIICSSKNYAPGQNSTPDGVLKLAKLIKNESNHVGRLEIYMKDNYKTICKNGFSSEAAAVACRQMGYTGGDLINPDPALQLTKTPEDNAPFGASDVQCSGSEKSLLDCNINLNSESIHCTHDLDVVLKCDGSLGDPSGASQLKSLEIKEAPPALGRLSAVKIKANCALTGRDQKFRGDPGSLYLISCPANCKSEKGNVWGVGVYTLDSSICQAAIHAGVIANNKGGSFAFVKTWGQKYFASLERNGIYSSEFRDAFLVSFTVSSLNSQLKNMWKIWKQNSVGVYLEENVQTGFLEKNKTLFTQEGKRIFRKSSRSNSSFLEMQHKTSLKQNMPAAVFEWIQPNPSEIFSEKENGSLLIQEHGMKQLSKFQILIKASLIDFKNKKAFLFSYSGCNGFNVFLDANDSITFGDACNEENQINTGIQFPLNDKTIIWAFYTNAVLKVAVFSEKMQKPIAKAFNKILDINHASSVGIGRRADTNDEFFFGYIDFVLVYDDEISFKEVSRVLNHVENKVKKTDSLEFTETIDNRACLSPCFKAAIPGEIGAPAPPKEADPYGSDIYYMPDSLLASRRGVGTRPSDTQSVGIDENNLNVQNDENGSIPPSSSPLNKSSKKMIDFTTRLGASIRGKMNKMKIGYRNPNNIPKDSSKSDSLNSDLSNSSFSINNNVNSNPPSDSQSDNQSRDFGTYEKSEENNIPSINLDCYTNLKDKRFVGTPGKIFRVKCPACNIINRPVYGTFIYHPLSSICKAANHAGTLKKQKPGYVLIEILPGKQIYNGSVSSDNLESGTFGAAEISFRTKSAMPTKQIPCSEAANSDQFGSGALGSKFVIYCPENCGKAPTSPIFGSEIYADMSSICVSAIHSGAVNDKGGEIEILIEGPQGFFKGTTSNGIASQSREAYNRAFRFIGNLKASTTFYKYKEDFSGSLIDRWSINQDVKAFNSKFDSWAFKVIELNSNGEKKKLKSISHTGTIKSLLANEYGSLIALKDAEFSNGRIRSSLFFNDRSGLFSILFRYTDKSNYYAIEFEPKTPQNNMRLISKKDGIYSILKSATHELEAGKFYRIHIILNNENISILMQEGDIREKKPVFALKSDALVRGTIGFAVNGNNALFINGVQIDEFKNNQNKYSSDVNKRTFKDLLKSLLPKSRALYCQKNYETSTEIARCLVPLNFCRMKCEEEISAVENILLFKCLRECTKSIQASGNAVKIQKKTWVPSVNEKIDFKPKNEKGFVRAQVISMKTKLRNRKNSIIFTIQFSDDQGTIYTENVESPSPNIQKCGYMLNRRKDCFKEESQ